MQRIDTPTRVVGLHGDGKDGFTGGDPNAGVPATELSAGWFNSIQETVAHPIEAAGMALQPGDPGQLTQAIRALSSTALVRQPANVTPAAGATGQGETPTLTASAYYSLYGVPQGAARFELSQSEAFDVILHAHTVAGAATAYTVPSGVLATNSVYFWRVAYQDAEGHWSLRSAPTGFTTGSVFSYVARPSITAPANNASGVSTTPTITFSAFGVVGGTDTHEATQVQIATDEAFASILHDSGVAGQPAAAYTVPAGAALPTLYILFVRVRHKAVGLGWSQWSPVVRFQVQARPAAPVMIAPAAGAVGVSPTPTLQSSGFTVPGGSDAHIASQWQIATDAGFTTIVHDSGQVSALTAYSVPAGAGLAALTTYRARARHFGAATGWGDWSAGVAWTTASPSGEQVYTTPGSHTFTVPGGVTSVCVVCVGGGEGGQGHGGAGGGLAWKNDIPVVALSQITVTVGAGGLSGSAHTNGGTSSFGAYVSATGGHDGVGGVAVGGDGGGAGGAGGAYQQSEASASQVGGGGGGAGGYTGNGGAGGAGSNVGLAGQAGQGGGGGGGAGGTGGAGYGAQNGGGGGGVGLYGQGVSGAGGAASSAMGGKGGSGGADGKRGVDQFGTSPNGGNYGGGAAGGGDGASGGGGAAGGGAVRIIWGSGRSFPLNAA